MCAAQSRIAELEAEVERLRDVVRNRSMEADDADHKAHTAWNDAIEAAATYMETHVYTSTGAERSMQPNKRAIYDMHHATAAEAIRALRR